MTTDFTELVERNDIDAIDIVTPNQPMLPSHCNEAGKHVMCEKPLAMSYHQARDMARVAQDTGVKMGLTLSIAITQQLNMLVSHQARIYRTDFPNQCCPCKDAMGPEVPLVGDYKVMTGTGVLGDLGSYIIDLVEWLTGQQIVSLVSDMQTFIHQRSLVDGSGVGQETTIVLLS